VEISHLDLHNHTFLAQGATYRAAMLLLFETSAGYALFKVLKPGKLGEVTDIWKHFTSAEDAAGQVKLKGFAPFDSTTDAVVAATCIVENTLDKSLKKFLKKSVVSKEISDELAVADAKLGTLIKEQLGVQCVCNDSVMELFRGIRGQMDSLLGGTEGKLQKSFFQRQLFVLDLLQS
jgi:nucleolar protein 58